MTSTVWIMRHGQAASGQPDDQRPLTEEGQREAARMGQWLFATLDEAQRRHLTIVTSPYLRARQTARIVADQLEVDRPVEELPLITPDDPIEPVLDWLQAHVVDAPCLLVSHMPLVGSLTARLADGDPRSSLPMPTAAIAGLEAEVWAAGCARLTVFRHPAELN